MDVDSELSDSLKEFTPNSRKRFLESETKKTVCSSVVLTSYSNAEIKKKLFYSDQEIDDFKEKLEKSTNNFYRRRDGQNKFDLHDESRTSKNSKLKFRFVRLECIYAGKPACVSLVEKKRKT